MERRTFLGLALASAAPSQTLRTRLLDAISRIEAVDTHEHILPESERITTRIDFYALASHYAMHDVISAGLPEDARQLLLKPEVSPLEKWRAFEPWWRYARLTGYGEALRIAIREVYGFDRIDATTITPIHDTIVRRNRKGLYADVLMKTARLKYCVNDEYWQPRPTAVDPAFFVLARKFDWFLTPITALGVERLAKLADVNITRLRDLKAALEKHFALALELGMVTVKSTMAYERDLHFENVSEADAERDFERLFKNAEPAPEDYRRLFHRPYRNLSSHMFHHLVQLAEAHGVPFQIHTGLHAGNGNVVSNSRPSLLNNLFFRYPRVQFDLFHIGFPYYGETAVLAKTFPNVYADFCWMHIVSPSASARALDEMLDMVPANKIFGFGGDYRYPELSYGHLLMTRRVIADVLAAKVQRKDCTEQQALELAQWLLHDNPDRLFSPTRRRRSMQSEKNRDTGG